MSAASAIDAILTLPDPPPHIVVGVADAQGSDVACHGPGVTADSVFDLASVSKVVGTASAVQRLASLGELGLDEPAGRWLAHTTCTTDTTVRTLLAHRAGLWEWQPLYTVDAPAWDVLTRLPLRYRPHSGRHYSDLGFMLLGRIVEAVTGSNLADAVTALVCEPMGLTATGFGPRPEAVPSSSDERAERTMIATGHPYPLVVRASRTVSWRRPVQGSVLDGNSHHGFAGVAGHAGLFATVGDLLRLAGLAAAAAAGDDSIWRPDISNDMFCEGTDVGQALGWRSTLVDTPEGPTRMLHHPGFTGCAVGFLPERGTAVAMLTNRWSAPTSTPVSTDALWAHVVHHTLTEGSC